MSLVLSYRYRLRPTRSQHAALRGILEEQRQLYNAALQERIDAYNKAGKSISLLDQQRSLTLCRESLPHMAEVPANLQRGTLKRLSEAFEAFFSRVKRGDRPGHPKFRSRDDFRSFDFLEFSGIRLRGSRLRFKGIPGGLRIHFHRPLPDGKPKCARFIQDAKGWSVVLAVEVPCAPSSSAPISPIGIDVGITTLAATSDGLLVPNPRASRRVQKEMRRRQRQLARARRGSKRRSKCKRRLAALHNKTRNVRATALHQFSAMVAKRHDLIAVEALNTKALARGMLARDVNDAGWTTLRNFLRYKAKRAGAHFVEVDPKFTSQECAQCGARARKALQERTHRCLCGHTADRDVNAAQVILNRAVAGPWAHNVAGYGERALGNLAEEMMRDATSGQEMTGQSGAELIGGRA